MNPPELILASTSPYRRELLSRLGLPFTVVAPEVEESPFPGETPEALVARLAGAKARAVFAHHPAAAVIGSDQMATVDGEVLGKPGGFERAVKQLRRISGRRVTFLTGLAVFCPTHPEGMVEVVPYAVAMRQLTEPEIRDYLLREQPYDCAGSFKSEGLGIALFEAMQGDDPTALVGLPLIGLRTLLARCGIAVLGADTHHIG